MASRTADKYKRAAAVLEADLATLLADRAQIFAQFGAVAAKLAACVDFDHARALEDVAERREPDPLNDESEPWAEPWARFAEGSVEAETAAPKGDGDGEQES